MNLRENTKEAVGAIRSNKVRAILTMLVIAFGLMALIGVLTAIDGIKFWFGKSFVVLGTNTYRIENYSSGVRNERDRQYNSNPPISFYQARQFKDEFGAYAPVSITAYGNRSASASYGGKTTQNNLQLLGADENYILISNYAIARGRNLTEKDISESRKVIVVGNDIAATFFPSEDPVGKKIQVDNKLYNIIGTFSKVGSAGFLGGDKVCIIPVTTLQSDFPIQKRPYSINVFSEKIDQIPELATISRQVFRRIRKLRPLEKDDFGIIRTESTLNNLEESLSYLTLAAKLIALITLFSAAIGLMNIMLVSVTERTREIGLRKAIGATQWAIQLQFLSESILICVIGGLLGIGSGILLGNLVGAVLGSPFSVPWNWVFIGTVTAVFVGVISGWYPALRASRVDPIESLRHE